MIERFTRRQEGSTALELALVLPVLLVLFLGICDMGFLLFQQMQVQAAADAGAAFAMARGPAAFNATTIGNVVTAAAYPTQTAITGAASWTCGCPNGTSGIAVVAGTPPNCCASPNCSNGFAPGLFVRVTAQATPTPIFAWPGYPALVRSGVLVRIR
jgi:Flp pilus assembly protein TadG